MNFYFNLSQVHFSWKFCFRIHCFDKFIPKVCFISSIFIQYKYNLFSRQCVYYFLKTLINAGGINLGQWDYCQWLCFIGCTNGRKHDATTVIRFFLDIIILESIVMRSMELLVLNELGWKLRLIIPLYEFVAKKFFSKSRPRNRISRMIKVILRTLKANLATNNRLINLDIGLFLSWLI